MNQIPCVPFQTPYMVQPQTYMPVPQQPKYNAVNIEINNPTVGTQGQACACGQAPVYAPQYPQAGAAVAYAPQQTSACATATSNANANAAASAYAPVAMPQAPVQTYVPQPAPQAPAAPIATAPASSQVQTSANSGVYNYPEARLYNYPQSTVPASAYQQAVLQQPVLWNPNGAAVADAQIQSAGTNGAIPVAPVVVPVQPVQQQNINIPPAPVVTASADSATASASAQATAQATAQASAQATAVPQPAVSQPQQAQTVEVKPQIVQPEVVAPQVDFNSFIAKLANADFDVQAAGMEEIANLVKEAPDKATELVDTKIFDALTNIVNYDSSCLEGPTKEQIAVREKIMAGKDVTEAENRLANTITPKEKAERNKSYALFTTAIMQKLYADEVARLSNQTVPLTELPGAITVVDNLKDNPNPMVRCSAIEALSYIQSPEYKKDLTTVFTVAQNDLDPGVVSTAKNALEKLAQV